jgi:hypothetical protein
MDEKVSWSNFPVDSEQVVQNFVAGFNTLFKVGNTFKSMENLRDQAT